MRERISNRVSNMWRRLVKDVTIDIDDINDSISRVTTYIERVVDTNYYLVMFKQHAVEVKCNWLPLYCDGSIRFYKYPKMVKAMMGIDTPIVLSVPTITDICGRQSVSIILPEHIWEMGQEIAEPIVWHELGHIQLGHFSSRHKASHVNGFITGQQFEIDADKVAVDKCGKERTLKAFKILAKQHDHILVNLNSNFKERLALMASYPN